MKWSGQPNTLNSKQRKKSIANIFNEFKSQNQAEVNRRSVGLFCSCVDQRCWQIESFIVFFFIHIWQMRVCMRCCCCCRCSSSARIQHASIKKFLVFNVKPMRREMILSPFLFSNQPKFSIRCYWIATPHVLETFSVRWIIVFLFSICPEIWNLHQEIVWSSKLTIDRVFFWFFFCFGAKLCSAQQIIGFCYVCRFDVWPIW